jgi:hypothetical protein
MVPRAKRHVPPKVAFAAADILSIQEIVDWKTSVCVLVKVTRE